MRTITDLMNEATGNFSETQEKCKKSGEELGKQFISKTKELENADDISFIAKETMHCFLAYLFDNMQEDETVGIGDAISQICKEYQVL